MNNITIISKALSDPNRYQILMMLSKFERGELEEVCCNSPEEGLCNCDIVSTLGMLQSRVSYHMKELTEAGLIKEETRGKWKFYSLNHETLREYIRQITLDNNL
ncbi:putative transcriptional regulator [Desulfitobacterium dichloroeliminans LMG P-21439]|uniref:Putative transcriptional regulator n=1 Tax=Desulfitobacterium dichloroeliminans (strain LMG P-21439 / DCA1) TaxID=871963 RepID=L0F609_DESDL|nr:metalloregulator ArsR/SmtB family transcription factor [Desulfitobacterium dichloroeliminans]AGA68475.1 putative transcriptional regulator [Desulfitobacterium dichloroeliminans LMG P-21439]